MVPVFEVVGLESGDGGGEGPVVLLNGDEAMRFVDVGQFGEEDGRFVGLVDKVCAMFEEVSGNALTTVKTSFTHSKGMPYWT